MRSEHSLLDICHVSKTFPVGKDHLHAVSDVSLHINKGECLGIVGESGCGKSTLARMVIGSLPPSSGNIFLNDIDYYKLKGKEKARFRRHIQMVFQEPISSFSPRMKIGTYLTEPRCNYDKTPRKIAMQEAVNLLNEVGLTEDYMSRYPHSLSGGQLQRVAIARALMIHPQLLVCDEATSALDVSIQQQVADLLVKLQEERQISCMFIGHDLALVRSVSQRMVVMYLGRVMEIINSETLEQDASHPYTKALLNAIFDVYCAQDQEIQLLEGDPPSPLTVKKGCPLASRCTHCMDICLHENPDLKEIETGHYVACHLFRTQIEPQMCTD